MHALGTLECQIDIALMCFVEFHFFRLEMRNLVKRSCGEGVNAEITSKEPLFPNSSDNSTVLTISIEFLKI